MQALPPLEPQPKGVFVMEFVQSTRMAPTCMAHVRGRRVNSRTPRLSAREIEVLLTWLRADSKQEVALELRVGVGTVNTHISRIRTKYINVGRPAPTKAALFARAIQDGHTTLDEW
ncbi:helix-turn-helix transcriptional regulator [Rhodococcus sp. AD45-ID]|uniref:LuxR C-terminal-related transcriptional regulator n=1 Tax=Rhodococcus sp. AD45-ID TaxID=2127033 RepID=UPI0009FCE892|nr:helix-turn-helix transcriptional regulator [Rhodococcus sp. AD45-ID]PSR42989.1 helix-turn-helix transcriptional regulator [Rhodococcus sp. AD45-ID]